MGYHKRLVIASITCASLGIASTLVMAWGVPLLGQQYHWWTPTDDTHFDTGVVDARLRSAWASDTWYIHRSWRTPGEMSAAGEPPATPPGYVAMPGDWSGMTALGQTVVDLDDYPRNRPRVSSVSTLATGWPFRAMASEVWTIDERPASAALFLRDYPAHCIVLREGRYDAISIPLRPIWTGLCADALFFGSAWFGLLVGLGALRRRRRIRARLRRGLCRQCGYDLRGLTIGSPCPECGGILARSDPRSGSLAVGAPDRL